jgi:hypothetical protein
MKQLPWRIQQMMEQIGLGINGGFCYVGATQKIYSNKNGDSKPINSVVGEDGLIDFECGLTFKVNGNQNWKMIVTVEGNDTYTVRLWAATRGANGVFGKVLYEYKDVYCDMLQDIVESTYDQAIKEHRGGWIPI